VGAAGEEMLGSIIADSAGRLDGLAGVVFTDWGVVDTHRCSIHADIVRGEAVWVAPTYSPQL
jgi:hypothetical protein